MKLTCSVCGGILMVVENKVTPCVYCLEKSHDQGYCKGLHAVWENSEARRMNAKKVFITFNNIDMALAGMR